MDSGEPVWKGALLDSPHGAPDKAARVRRMFNAIAPRYELINTLFSAGRDAVWRRKAVELAHLCEDDDVLDIACGTGSFARAFAAAGARSVVGCDFAHDMLLRAAARPRTPVLGQDQGRFEAAPGCRHRRSTRRRRCGTRAKVRWCEADAVCLPFRSASVSITSCAFGVRNFQDLDAGLREMWRVLRSGGRAVILEFTRPSNRLARRLYGLYSTRLMPTAASLLSGDRSGAYRYLPRSVVSFLSAEQMCARMRHVGFTRTMATPMTMGIVTVYVALRD